MKKTVSALLLGIMLGMKGVSKMTHLIYLSIIVALIFRPAHFVWHVGYVSLLPSAMHLPMGDDYRTGAIGIICAALVLVSLIWAVCVGNRRNW